MTKNRRRQEPTEVYEILDETDPRFAQIAEYTAATTLLRAGELTAAPAALPLQAHGTDPVVARHLERATA